MASNDYAIVIGVQRYPMFGRTEQDAHDLRAPDTDASEIRDWLIDPAGGNVPPDHVRLIRSQDFVFDDPFDAQPQESEIKKAFDRLHAMSGIKDRAGLGRNIGRRFYLYVSGHGFARRRSEGAVFTANATRERTYHIAASAWSEWFANAAYFQEVVLWMDTCMDPQLSVPMQPAGYAINQALTRGAEAFSAFAAVFPQVSVERMMGDGRYHGVFTFALLEGLRGAAADPDTLAITSQSLRSFLTQKMPTLLSDADRRDPSITGRPDFGPMDPVEFGIVRAVPTFPVTIEFPPEAVGQPFTVQTGSPLVNVLSGQIALRTQTVNLCLGQYFVRVAGAGWQQDLLVTGGEGGEHGNGAD